MGFGHAGRLRGEALDGLPNALVRRGEIVRGEQQACVSIDDPSR